VVKTDLIMGGIIKAICKCGFETDFMTGSSATNYNEVCNAPAICFKCSKLVTRNYLSEDAACPACSNPLVFYNQRSLQDLGENEKLLHPQTGVFILPVVNCLCPKCNKKEMKFLHTGCWD